VATRLNTFEIMMTNSPVAVVSFAIHQIDGRYVVRVSEAGSDLMMRARAVLTKDEAEDADGYVHAAAVLLANYAFRSLTPDFVDNIVPVGPTGF
jgi:hypothetical protein